MPSVKEICEKTLDLNGYVFGKSKGAKGTEVIYVPSYSFDGNFPDRLSKGEREERLNVFMDKLNSIEGGWWVSSAAFEDKMPINVDDMNIEQVTSSIGKHSIIDVKNMILNGYHQVCISLESGIKRRNVVVSKFQKGRDYQLDFIVHINELFGRQSLDYWDEKSPFDTKPSKTSLEFRDDGTSGSSSYGQYARFHGYGDAIHPDNLNKIDGRIYGDDEQGSAIDSFWQNEDVNKDYMQIIDPKDKAIVFHRKGKDWYVSPVVEREEVEFAFWCDFLKEEDTDHDYIAFVQDRDLEIEERLAQDIRDLVSDTKREAIINSILNESEQNGVIEVLGFYDRYEAKDMIFDKEGELEGYPATWSRIIMEILSVDDKMLIINTRTGEKFRTLQQLARYARIVGGSIDKTNLPGSEAKAWCVKYNEEEYHFNLAEVIADSVSEDRTVREFFTFAMEAIGKRENLVTDSELGDANKVFVSIDDSISSGNCEEGTLEMVSFLRINPRVTGGIRGDVLLGIRNDNFTRRAVKTALIRANLIEGEK